MKILKVISKMLLIGFVYIVLIMGQWLHFASHSPCFKDKGLDPKICDEYNESIKYYRLILKILTYIIILGLGYLLFKHDINNHIKNKK